MFKRHIQKSNIQSSKCICKDVNVNDIIDMPHHYQYIYHHYKTLMYNKHFVILLIMLLQLFASIMLAKWTRIKYSLPHHTDVRFFHASQYRKFMTLSHKKYICQSLLNSFIDLSKHYNISYYITQGGLLGIHRYNRLLYWDEDIDVTVVDKSVFVNLTKHNNNEFIMENKIYVTNKEKVNDDIWTWWNHNNNDDKFILYKKKYDAQLCHVTGLRMDIDFHADFINNGRFKQFSVIYNDHDTAKKYLDHITFPLKTCAIVETDNILFTYCPKETKLYLQLIYGNNLNEFLSYTYQLQLNLIGTIALYILCCYLSLHYLRMVVKRVLYWKIITGNIFMIVFFFILITKIACLLGGTYYCVSF
eukprot:324115_1